MLIEKKCEKHVILSMTMVIGTHTDYSFRGMSSADLVMKKLEYLLRKISIMDHLYIR